MRTTGIAPVVNPGVGSNADRVDVHTARRVKEVIVDITKAVAAVKAAQDAVQALVTTTANNASKAPRDIRGLGDVVKAGDQLVKAVEKLESARDRTIPPAPKEEKAADKKK